MVLVAELPEVNELNSLIDSVSAYPVRAGELAQLAVAEGAGRRVIDFYRAFPYDAIFTNSDDLSVRSEQVLLMSAEEEEQPPENLRSPQE